MKNNYARKAELGRDYNEVTMNKIIYLRRHHARIRIKMRIKMRMKMRMTGQLR